MATYTHPMRFPGTEAEIAANRATHQFWGDPDGDRCMDCDCRPWGYLVTWPCGTRNVPRVTATTA